MRFMMLMIPKGYEKAAAGTVPDAKAVEAMMKTTNLCKRRACCSRSTGFTRHRWGRASPSPEAIPR